MVKKVSIIVPSYNESENIAGFLKVTREALKEISQKYKFDILFIDDGSTDQTLTEIKKIKDPDVHFVSFSRNFGKEAAIYAGLDNTREYDYLIFMDVDLQDPPTLIPEMILKMEKGGFDSVATARANRKGEKAITSFFSNLFYQLFSKMSQVKLIPGARDFRIISRQMADAILSMPEKQRFSKGIFNWIGFKTDYIYYENINRKKGQTKWNFWKLFKYAIDGIVNFSTVPLTIVSLLGFISTVVGFIGIIAVIARRMIGVYSQFGWASLISILMFFAGLQMFSLGVIGRYISTIYLETKNRPMYVIKEMK
ncbi:MAG: glycosyltransferase family 2 protein [Lactobacillaceae bacterium]|jgi:glycosyltransferase involved in cell wall biosynthesis|nr:glycosyltransferase family 2 protein [Lactobacillaceae bacterium]